MQPGDQHYVHVAKPCIHIHFSHVCTCIHVYTYVYATFTFQWSTITCVHERSVIETRQSKAKLATPQDNSFFSREKEELLQAGLEPTTFCVLGRHFTNWATKVGCTCGVCTCKLAFYKALGWLHCKTHVQRDYNNEEKNPSIYDPTMSCAFWCDHRECDGPL